MEREKKQTTFPPWMVGRGRFPWGNMLSGSCVIVSAWCSCIRLVTALRRVSLVCVSVPLLQLNLPCHYCSRAACLPACLPQHLNTNKIPHHHHHDDQAAAASSVLHLKPWCQQEYCRLGKTTEHLIWWAVEKEQGDHKALTADTHEESLI